MENGIDMSIAATARRSWEALRGKPLRITAAAFLAWALANMDQSLFGYAVPQLMTDFGVDLNAIGVIISASFLFAILSVTVIGLLADLWGRRLMLALALGISAALVGLQAFASSVTALAVLRVVGFGISAGLSPITSALVAECSPPRLRAMMVAVLQCAYPFGWFVASILVVPIMPVFGWRGLFLTAFAVVPMAYILYRMIPDNTHYDGVVPVKLTRSPLLELFGPVYRRRALLCAAAFVCYGGATAGTVFYFPKFFQDVRGYTSETAALLVGSAYAVAMIGYIGGAIVGNSVVGRRRTVVLWSWLGALGLLLTVWLPQTFLQDVLAFGLTTIFLYGTSCVLTIYLVGLFPTQLRATGAAVCGSASLSVGYSIFPVLVSSSVLEIGWQWSFSIIIVPAVMAAGLLILAIGELPSVRDAELARSPA